MAPVVEGLKANGNRVTTILQAARPEAVYGKERLAGGQRPVDSRRWVMQTEAPRPLECSSRLVAEHRPRPDRSGGRHGLPVRDACRCAKPRARPAIKTMVHLAPIMVDGTGMCGACRFSVKGSNRFACVHGPEFDGHEVDGWDVLLARRCTYADESTLQPGFQCRGCSQW